MIIVRRRNYRHKIKMQPSRHLISRLRRQLLLKEKPYLDRIAEQCYRNLTAGEISPGEAGFHLPKGDFTPAIAGISPFRRKVSSPQADFTPVKDRIYFGLSGTKDLKN